MQSLKNRSSLYELLDEVNNKISSIDLIQNLKELNVINTLLGGHQITLDGCKQLFTNANLHEALTIVEIGCGGGDNLITIAKYCNSNKINVQLIGVDIKPDCINYAIDNCKAFTNIQFQYCDYQLTKLPAGQTIIFNSLFCHHFAKPSLLVLLHWMKKNATVGFFINDLHRNYIAYYSIKILTTLFSKSYLVKHDAPLSVARGFQKKEWIEFFDMANIKATIQWKWAFRHLIIVKNE